ncbi:Uncharacterised protein [Legionella steigerwaltii]|uniref:Uncharacterized protein n=1 Tax=Legionella steigerwaltii TaxID=460 RepID=A0A378LC58_9GAMM|nr:hypothetical protein [Legionella steigerwaltii]KTD71931.1 hypothetical protein Lstg_2787 [Legionella steigerwaltii]STY23920.1 Uncharacterised protein [Legionella steigerwaltii]
MAGKDNDSTSIIIKKLDPSTATEVRSPADSFAERLRRLNLGNEFRMMALIQKHPNYGNRLISLFKALKEHGIDLTETLVDLITHNISQIGGVVNLFELIKKEVLIDPKSLSLELLFNAAKFDTSIAQSTRDLEQMGLLDADTFKLLLAYPELALKISQLLNTIQAHAYKTSIIVNKLYGASIAAERMDTVLNLLDLLLENNLYYPEIVDVFLRQEKYIDKIYEGAKKLAAEKCLFPDYFDLLETNPQNANIFAKNVLLLREASLISPSNPESVVKVSQLGAGAFHFMKLLQHADMLDEINYQKICRTNNILDRKEVIDELSNLPMIVAFQPEELKTMLDIVDQTILTERDVRKFNRLIQDHLFVDYHHTAACPCN